MSIPIGKHDDIPACDVKFKLSFVVNPKNLKASISLKVYSLN